MENKQKEAGVDPLKTSKLKSKSDLKAIQKRI